MDKRFREITEAGLKIVATRENISELKTELKADISGLDTKISDSKAEMLRWVSGFFIGDIRLVF